MSMGEARERTSPVKSCVRRLRPPMFSAALQAKRCFHRSFDVAAYVDRVRTLPGVKAWIDDALAEKDFLDFEEPYRLQPTKG